MKAKQSKKTRQAHIEALARLGFKTSKWNTLRRIEESAHRLAEQYCNGEVEGDEYETQIKAVEHKVEQMFWFGLPAGFFVNGDPRGYALKIDAGDGDQHNPHRIPEGLHMDWGGYGILAPSRF